MEWPLSWFALCLAIPAVQITTCTMGSEHSWLSSLFFFTPVAIIVLACIWFSRRHHTRAAVPNLALSHLRFCRFCTTLDFSGAPSLHSLDWRDGSRRMPSSWWTRFWAPLQLLICGVCGYLLIACWNGWFQQVKKRRQAM